MKQLFIAITGLLFFNITSAQQNPEAEAPVTLLLRGYPDHVYVRSLVSGQAAFLEYLKNGLIIERAIAVKGTKADRLNYQPLTGNPFRKITEAELTAQLKINPAPDSTQFGLLVFAMGMSDSASLYKQGDVLRNGLQSLKESREQVDNALAFTTLATLRSRWVAAMMGMFTDDIHVTRGAKYVYRVRINTTNKELGSWSYEEVTCNVFDEKNRFDRKKVEVLEGDQQISFSFDKSEEYFAFSVERSDDQGKTFTRLNKSPMLNLSAGESNRMNRFGYVDTARTNYHNYIYRIWVSTAFGDELRLHEFSAMPRDKTPPPAPDIKLPVHNRPNTVTVSWQMLTTSNDLAGFNIYRSDKDSGVYRQINKQPLSKNTEVYADTSFNRESLNFYKVEAFDTAGNRSRSFSAYAAITDSTPPAVPVIEKALIDSSGKIIIRVKPNKEKDFAGYQVLKSNAPEHEFSVVQETYKDSLGAATFVIYDSTTLNSLTPYIYYQLVAFDQHYNQSEPSAMIQVKRPDTIRPVAPLIRNFKLSDTSVYLSFVNSTSEDVSVNYLLRREISASKYDTLLRNRNPEVRSFTDLRYEGGKSYEYTMIARDSSGLYSRNGRTIIVNTLPLSLPVPILKASVSANRKMVLFEYQILRPVPAKKPSIEIYKKRGESGTWEMLMTRELSDKKPLTDEKNISSGDYFYMARIVDEKGNESVYSDIIQIKIL